MKSIKHHFPPNIVAGTNFNIARFNELYRWIESCRADAVFLNLSSYGLLCDELGNSFFDLSINGFQLKLNKCIALTATGVLIGIFPENSEGLELKFEEHLFRNNEKLDLYLVADLKGKRKAFGQINSSEIPTRLPFSSLSFRMETHVPDEELGRGVDYIKIGEVSMFDSFPSLLDYIPSCASSGAHPDLWKKQNEFAEELKKFYQALIDIIYQVGKNTSFKDTTRLFANFCENWGRFLAEHIPQLNRLNEYSDPQLLFSMIQSFAKCIDFDWQIIKQNQKVNLGAIMRITDRKSTNDFELDVVTNLANHIFSQRNLENTIGLIDDFMSGFVMPIITFSKQRSIWEIEKMIEVEGTKKNIQKNQF